VRVRPAVVGHHSSAEAPDCEREIDYRKEAALISHNPFRNQPFAFEGQASVATKYTDRIAPNGKSIVMVGGDVWFSQASLARLFSKTKQNVSLHLQDICDRAGDISLTRQLQISQVEGRRHITRMVTHYSLDACQMIALRGQHWNEHNWLMQLASEVNPRKRDYRVIPIKERDFHELIETLLRGIVKVEYQYPVGKYFIDFYLPDFALAIEFDEFRHATPRNVIADRKREEDIKRSIPPIEFIRVPEGQELVKLNELLRTVVARLGRDHGSRRDPKWRRAEPSGEV
jgi:very-short-patch-repair endonuclease